MVQAEYEKWLHHDELDETLRQQLLQMKTDKTAIEDAFYTNLTCGTGGIRGILGPGTNRMNIYTVRKTAEGLAQYLINHTVNYQNRGVVIAYDSRHMSREFAFEIAKVLGVHRIKTFIFESIQPTPLLSFAVRHLVAVAGVMITASHNPPSYNGLKVYNEKGSQITEETANLIIHYINEVNEPLQIKTKSIPELHADDLLHMLHKEIGAAYCKQLERMSKMSDSEKKERKQLSIVFTPLHGTATELVLAGLRQLSFSD